MISKSLNRVGISDFLVYIRWTGGKVPKRDKELSIVDNAIFTLSTVARTDKVVKGSIRCLNVFGIELSRVQPLFY